MGSFTALLAAASAFSLASGLALDKRAAVGDCLSSAKVPTYSSGSTDYTLAIKPFNLRVPFTPAAVAVPQTVQHVQDAVACGVKNNVTVTPKSGGHSYASHGLGGEDGHLLIWMRNFKNVTVDTASSTANIGPGGRLGNVAQALYSQGKQAISHGTCPGVGVGGLTLHGGYGLSSRQHGLTLDNVLEATVVLANSTVVTASPTQNQDLFWALRGAGAAYGVVTNFKFKTHTAPESNVVFSYNINLGNAAAASKFLANLQDFAQNKQPAEMNMRFFIQSYGASLSGVYYGTTSAFQTAISPLLSTVGNPAGQVQTKGWIDTLSSYAYMSLTQPDNYDIHETFFSKSLMPSNLNQAALDAFSQYWFNTARGTNRDWYVMIDLHGGSSSAITKNTDNTASYAHRNATFKMQFYDRVSTGSYNAAWQSFMNGWVDGVQKAQPDTTFGMYINYADSSLSPADAHKHYWLGSYDRLATIKDAYDPGHVFEGPQLVGSK